MRHKNSTNPFTFGDLALDDAFTDREDELRELTADMANGQNVLVYAPRRYGKSSLVLRAAQEALRKKALVGYCDVMKTPTDFGSDDESTMSFEASLPARFSPALKKKRPSIDTQSRR